MKSGFKDPIAKKVKEKTMKSPWNFEQPPYDERSSCFVNTGSHQGVGYRQPVGSVGGAKPSNMIPKGNVKTIRVDEKAYKNLNTEIDV